MLDEIIATASTKIKAPVSAVWQALINPELIKKYMWGSTVISDWKDGSPIVWKGEWKGQPYEDKGIILTMAHEKMLQYSHFSPMEGLEDKPSSYRIVTIELFDEHDGVLVSLMQDNNPTEKAKEEAEKNWKAMLESLKALLEQ